MSVTTSTNTIRANALQIFADYDLHHSGDSPVSRRHAASHPPHTGPSQHDNPDWWPTDHRRVPDHRPINRNLDRSQRPDGTSAIETVFIFTMLRGVQLNANVSYVWRNTGAYWNGKLFRYSIGGEK